MIKPVFIKTAASRKVVDIKSLPTEELETLKKESKELLDKLEDSIGLHKENASNICQIAFGTGVLTFLSAYAKNPIDPNIIKFAAIIEGAAILFSLGDISIGTIIREKRIDRERNNQGKLRDEIDRRGLEIERHRALRELKRLKKRLESVEVDEYIDRLRSLEMETYLSEGADSKLLALPGIQKVFAVAAMPYYPEEHRVYIHDSEVRDVRPNGTFTIGTHEKLPFGCLADDSSALYVVRYTDSRSDGNYIQITNGDRRIYLDKEGNITRIEKSIKYGTRHATITLSLKDDELVPLKNLNATMTELKRRQIAKTDNVDVPTIDFDSIRKIEGNSNDKKSSTTNVPIIEVAEMTGGLSR